MSIKIDDKLPIFTGKVKIYADNAVKELAKDIFSVAKSNAPYQKGRLRNESKPIDKKGEAHYWVQFRAIYARYQEFGGDGRRVVRKYTTPGTGKGYLQNAGNRQTSRALSVIKKHLTRGMI